MQILKADTAVKVVIGPVVAVGDGFTPVTTLALGTADEAEILKHDAAAVTDISGNTFAAITGADGYYNLTITAAQLDTEGMLTVLINDDSLCLPVKATFMVVSANVYDSLFAADGTDKLQVDAVQWLGTACATPTTAGVPEVDVTHVSGTSQTAGDLAALITTLDTVADTINTNVGTPSNLGSGATVAANLVDIESQTDDIGAAGAGLTALPWNAAWDAEVQSEVADALAVYDAATGTDIVNVKYMGPRGPGVYLDSTAGNTNTTLGTDGTYDNPVSTLAAATTIASALSGGPGRIYIINQALLTLAQTYDSWEFVGLSGSVDAFVGNQGPTITLGSQSVNNSTFFRCSVTGTQGSSDDPFLMFDGDVNGVTNLFGVVYNSNIRGVNTPPLAGINQFYNCHAITTSDYVFNTACNLYMHECHGAFTLKSMAAGDTVRVRGGSGSIALNASCTGGTLTMYACDIDVLDSSSTVTVTSYPITDHVGYKGQTIVDWEDAGRLDAILDSAAAAMTTTLTESYAADGAEATAAQMLYMIQQAITEFAISDITKTIKKLDGETTAATETLDDASNPTSITRAT